ARVEHVFGQQQNSMGGKIVRTIGIVRARFKIGMMNLGYNIRRLVQLERMAAAPRLSALTGGLRVPSCKGPRGRRPGVKTVPDRGLTSAQTLQPLAQLRQKSPKASIVRGSQKSSQAVAALARGLPLGHDEPARHQVLEMGENRQARRLHEP